MNESFGQFMNLQKVSDFKDQGEKYIQDLRE